MPRPLEAYVEYRFHPGGPFVARRCLRIRGQEYQPGEAIDAALLSTRRWRQLYESRRVACIPEGDDASRMALARARSAGAAQAAPPAKPAAETNATNEASPPEAAEGNAAGPYSMKHQGNGRYVILDPRGTPMTDPMERAKAKAMVADLNG